MIGIPYEIVYHEAFSEDLKEFLNKYSNYKGRILKAIRQKSHILEKYGPHVIGTEKNFEKVVNFNGLYAIRLIVGNPNLRILFSFLGNNKIIYLVIFYEKDKKKDYDDKYGPIAEKRLKNYILMGG